MDLKTGLAACVLALALPIAADAQQVYSFNGVLTDSNFNPGITPVSGTFTLDISAARPEQMIATPSQTLYENSGGSIDNAPFPPPTGIVFEINSFEAGTFSYASDTNTADGAFEQGSYARYLPSQGYLSLSQFTDASQRSDNSSDLYLTPYTFIGGGPDPAAIGRGDINLVQLAQNGVVQQVYFNISSVTAVPLPPTLWMLLGGLGLLGLSRRQWLDKSQPSLRFAR